MTYNTRAMLSLLIVASDQNSALTYALTICRNGQIDPVDITRLAVDTANIGIASVRDIQKKIFLKPIRSIQKAVIIENAEALTTEAQNALLKILEEPPANTIIMLLVPHQDILLPTIISRCKIVLLAGKMEKILEENFSLYQTLLKNLQTMPLAEKLKTAQDNSKDKEQTLNFLNGCAHVLRERILQDQSLVSKTLLLQDAYMCAATTNVNLRFLLEQFLLSFDSRV